MGRPSNDAYTAVIAAIERSRRLIDELETLPPSPKRDQTLELLRESHGKVVRRLDEVHSDSHRN
jgi:hypothetical protein